MQHAQFAAAHPPRPLLGVLAELGVFVGGGADQHLVDRGGESGGGVAVCEPECGGFGRGGGGGAESGGGGGQPPRLGVVDVSGGERGAGLGQPLPQGDTQLDQVRGGGGGAGQGGGDLHPSGVGPGVGQARGGVLVAVHPAAVEFGGGVDLVVGVLVLGAGAAGQGGQQQGVQRGLRVGGRSHRRWRTGVEHTVDTTVRMCVRQGLFCSLATLFTNTREPQHTTSAHRQDHSCPCIADGPRTRRVTDRSRGAVRSPTDQAPDTSPTGREVSSVSTGRTPDHVTDRWRGVSAIPDHKAPRRCRPAESPAPPR